MNLVTILEVLAIFWYGIDSFSVDNHQKKIESTNQSRVKRQSKVDGKKNSNGQAPIIQPGLGRSVCLGCLYYGTTDYISRSEHFWKKSTILEQADIESSTHNSWYRSRRISSPLIYGRVSKSIWKCGILRR